MNRVLSFAEFQQCVEAGLMPATFNQPSGFNTGTNVKNDGVAIVVEDDEEDSFNRQRDIYSGSSSFTTRPQPISLNQAPQSSNTQAPFSGFPLPPPPVFNAPVPPSLPSLSPPTAPAPPSLHSAAGGMFNKVFPPPPVLPGGSAPSSTTQPLVPPVPFSDVNRQDTGRSISSNFPAFPDPPSASSFIGRTLSSQPNANESWNNSNSLMNSQSQVANIDTYNSGNNVSSFNQGSNMGAFNKAPTVDSSRESNFEALDSWRRNDRNSADQWQQPIEKRPISQSEMSQGQLSMNNSFSRQETDRFERASFNNQRSFDPKISSNSPQREPNNWTGQRNEMEDRRASEWQKSNVNPPWVNAEPERRLSDISNQCTVAPWNNRPLNEPPSDARRSDNDRGSVPLPQSRSFEKAPKEDNFARRDNYNQGEQLIERRSYPEMGNKMPFEAGRSQNFAANVPQPQLEPTPFKGNATLIGNDSGNSFGQQNNSQISNERFGSRLENDIQSLGSRNNDGRNSFENNGLRKGNEASFPRPLLSAPVPMTAPDSFGSIRGKNGAGYGVNSERREQEMLRNEARPTFDSFKPSENRGFTPLESFGRERGSFETSGPTERNFGGVTQDSGNPNMMPIGGNRASDRSTSLERARPIPPPVISEPFNKPPEMPRPLMEPIKPLIEPRTITEREGPGGFIGNRSQSLDRNQSEFGRQVFGKRIQDHAFREQRESLPNRDQNRNQWQGGRDRSVNERPNFATDTRGQGDSTDKRNDRNERKQDMPRNARLNMESLNDEKWNSAKLPELSTPAGPRPIPPSRPIGAPSRPIEPAKRPEQAKDVRPSISNQATHRPISATLDYIKDSGPEKSEEKRPIISTATPAPVLSKDQLPNKLAKPETTRPPFPRPTFNSTAPAPSAIPTPSSSSQNQASFSNSNKRPFSPPFVRPPQARPNIAKVDDAIEKSTEQASGRNEVGKSFSLPQRPPFEVRKPNLATISNPPSVPAIPPSMPPSFAAQQISEAGMNQDAPDVQVKKAELAALATAIHDTKEERKTVTIPKNEFNLVDVPSSSPMEVGQVSASNLVTPKDDDKTSPQRVIEEEMDVTGGQFELARDVPPSKAEPVRDFAPSEKVERANDFALGRSVEPAQEFAPSGKVEPAIGSNQEPSLKRPPFKPLVTTDAKHPKRQSVPETQSNNQWRPKEQQPQHKQWQSPKQPVAPNSVVEKVEVPKMPIVERKDSEMMDQQLVERNSSGKRPPFGVRTVSNNAIPDSKLAASSSKEVNNVAVSQSDSQKTTLGGNIPSSASSEEIRVKSTAAKHNEGGSSVVEKPVVPAPAAVRVVSAPKPPPFATIKQAPPTTTLTSPAKQSVTPPPRRILNVRKGAERQPNMKVEIVNNQLTQQPIQTAPKQDVLPTPVVKKPKPPLAILKSETTESTPTTTNVKLANERKVEPTPVNSGGNGLNSEMKIRSADDEKQIVSTIIRKSSNEVAVVQNQAAVPTAAPPKETIPPVSVTKLVDNPQEVAPIVEKKATLPPIDIAMLKARVASDIESVKKASAKAKFKCNDCNLAQTAKDAFLSHLSEQGHFEKLKMRLQLTECFQGMKCKLCDVQVTTPQHKLEHLALHVQ